MKPRKAAFIVCNNGLGHFTRVSRVIYALLQNNDNLRVDLFCAKKCLEIKSDDPQVLALINSDKVQMHYTSSNINWRNTAPTTSISYDESVYKSPEILKADFVVSDNITEVLKYRDDTILMGSFLWSEIFQYHFPDNSFVQEFVAAEVNQLIKYNPSMICLEDFAMQYVKDYTSPFSTEIILDQKHQKFSKDKIRSILISPGGTDSTLSLTKELSNSLIESSLNVYVPNRLKQMFHEKTIGFDFSTKAFLDLDLIVARAGIGTITDSVKYNLPIICIGGEDNFEIQYNSERIQILGHGINAKSSAVKALEGVTKLQNIKEYKKVQSTLHKVQTNGLNQIIKFIETRI